MTAAGITLFCSIAMLWKRIQIYLISNSDFSQICQHSSLGFSIAEVLGATESKIQHTALWSY